MENVYAFGITQYMHCTASPPWQAFRAIGIKICALCQQKHPNDEIDLRVLCMRVHCTMYRIATQTHQSRSHVHVYSSNMLHFSLVDRIKVAVNVQYIHTIVRSLFYCRNSNIHTPTTEDRDESYKTTNGRQKTVDKFYCLFMAKKNQKFIFCQKIFCWYLA